MKAKKIGKIRKTCKIYQVFETLSLFGEPYSDYPTEVLAKNALQAAKRYHRRRHHRLWFHTDETSVRFGQVKVVPKLTPYERLIKYFD